MKKGLFVVCFFFRKKIILLLLFGHRRKRQENSLQSTSYFFIKILRKPRNEEEKEGGETASARQTTIITLKCLGISIFPFPFGCVTASNRGEKWGTRRKSQITRVIEKQSCHVEYVEQSKKFISCRITEFFVCFRFSLGEQNIMRAFWQPCLQWQPPKRALIILREEGKKSLPPSNFSPIQRRKRGVSRHSHLNGSA